MGGRITSLSFCPKFHVSLRNVPQLWHQDPLGIKKEVWTTNTPSQVCGNIHEDRLPPPQRRQRARSAWYTAPHSHPKHPLTVPRSPAPTLQTHSAREITPCTSKARPPQCPRFWNRHRYLGCRVRRRVSVRQCPRHRSEPHSTTLVSWVPFTFPLICSLFSNLQFLQYWSKN